MEEFLVTDFLINGSNATDDLQLFDTRDFGLPQDYVGMDTQSTSEGHSASGSPFDEDLQMEDAPPAEWMPLPVAPIVVRPPSPNRVLAMQSVVNQILKVEPLDEVALSVSTPSSSSEKSAKKRRRDSDEDVSDAIPEGLAAVFLKRDQLLTISSAEHEAFVQRISNVRDFTEAELKEVKRQRRLIKNREYAQTSRQKKKVTMGHVKDQVSTLETENDDLKSELDKMRARVMELELENASLRVQLSKEQTSSEDTSFDSNVVVDLTPKTKSKAGKATFGFRPAMAATSVFFVFLFAFGLLFNSPLFNAAFSSASLPGAKNVNPYHTGRTIFNVDQPSHSESAPVDDAFSSTDVFANVSNDFINACINAVNNTC